MIVPSRRRFAAVVASCLLVAGCATGDFGSLGGSPNERRAEQLAAAGEYSEAAGVYIGLASQASGAVRDRLTLLAVEQWLFAGDGRRAESALSQVARPAGGELNWLWSADVAALALWDGEPDRALTTLEPIARQPLPADHRARIEALRADAWFQKDDPLRAIDLYMQRETWLDGPGEIRANQRRLWAGLRVANVQSLRDAAEATFDPVVRGWLTLAALANSTGQQGIGWANGVVQWRESNASHPATEILQGMSLVQDTLLGYPRQIALLLPLSGSNASAGSAIKNGFVGAFLAATAGSGSDQRIRLYDVEADGVARAYADAVSDGAEFVVGPLVRRSVGELALELMLPVPVLALNYLPDDQEAPPGFFQFALAPEDEAAAAAARAIDDGARRAIALVPGNAWGRRVLGAFATEFEGLGGTLVEFRNYDPENQDFSFEIESVMALTESVQRYQRLRANLGGSLQFDPRRRQDVDLIFLAGDGRAGRLFKSQLKFHYSGEVPVYSTSFIYSMDGRSDADLEDVMFADAPWLISPPAWIADFPQKYGEFWPSERRFARLHAMGYDAYHLVGELYNAREGYMEEIAGATGQLFLTSDGRIHRRLAWARFENGKPVALPAAHESGDRSTSEEPDPTSPVRRDPGGSR